MSDLYDAVVVGAGPNGLAAGITLARAGLRVLILEAAATVGGGARSAELTLPGFVHDVCSAFHPLGLASPFMRSLPLESHGLRWIHPPVPLAHPLDRGAAVLLERTVETTAQGVDPDTDAYRRLMQPLVAGADALLDDLLGPLRLPQHPVLTARFGLAGLRSVRAVAGRFSGPKARALLAGLGAHAILPLHAPGTAAFALILGMLGHLVGWPVAEGGTQRIADALASVFRSLGGTIQTRSPVTSLADLPSSRAVLLDLSPRQVAHIAGDRLPDGYRRRLARYRYGPGAFKVDWALDGPIPWAAPECLRAGVVHVGGTLEEIAAAEDAVARGRVPERPFVLVGQQSLFDASRAPYPRQTAWAYCHVPSGSREEMTGRIEAQIERFAPGFRERILARSVRFPADLERENPNFVGGDIAAGSQDLRQLLARSLRRDPYATPVKGLYLCSASTPPGAGVHGMCGYHAARSALRREFGM
ncbi:MAG: NAD(P)/FAD-dependent oxidoreductase [Armatimonadota bacterium]|nr:NAD(P)/FAD-dependent oxidoreductase [Armatimonadota bacterium]MDR7451509.1 NAD(P)/FAD-dependent oxidoreductase [Armatimonadota bacterium]MDR7467476.1 NAD(P)/FAD-dependent oxidoreductase [Armatimonadota bacterium]MDR7494350.1 NAD(P)/FAD-dependent oxidoreductase [Armatimonadota bacterium]MDR7499167.1 NAD(P)/FAD-dependent oxidoreductase [Armatimonadota bacterium]